MKVYAQKTLNLSLFLILLFFFLLTNAQVGINTTSPNGILEVNSSSYGIVLPRISLTATNTKLPVVNPNGIAPSYNLAVGTVVYNNNTTTTGSYDVVPGIYVWSGTEWIPKFTKKHAVFYKQSGTGIDGGSGFRTASSSGYQDIPNLASKTFTPKYTGVYKLEISVNFGAGEALDNGSELDVVSQTADFRFTFNGVDHDIPMNAWSVQGGGGSNYFAIWEQTSIIVYKTLTAGTIYNFNLKVDQGVSSGFFDNGETGVGRGYIGLDIPCSVEFIYLEE
ncbi:MAG: hypothetical protein QM499_05485 [Flavobacteriaceae bacterium]